MRLVSFCGAECGAASLGSDTPNKVVRAERAAGHENVVVAVYLKGSRVQDRSVSGAGGGLFLGSEKWR